MLSPPKSHAKVEGGKVWGTASRAEMSGSRGKVLVSVSGPKGEEKSTKPQCSMGKGERHVQDI